MTGELILTSYTYDDGRIAINNAFSGISNLNNLLLDGDFSGGTGGGVIYSAGTDLYDIFLTSDSTLASNGLTKGGNTVVLGGELTGDTTVLGGGFNLYLSGNTTSGSINLYQKGFVGASYGQVRVHNILGAQLIGSDGVDIVNTVTTTNGVASMAYNSGGTTVEVNVDSNGVNIIDNFNNKGIFYNANYHTNYTERSLPDVGWVSAHTFSSATATWSASTGLYSVVANNPTINVASNDYAFAWGSGNTASSTGATAFGMGNVASGIASTAFGNGCVASNSAAIAAIFKSQAKGPRSIAIGARAISEGTDSTSIGDSVTATTTGSFAIGKATISSGVQSFAGGLSSQSLSTQSFAFGNDVYVFGEQSASFGSGTKISGAQSFGAGASNSALTFNATVFGFANLIDAPYSFANGAYTYASGNYSFVGGQGYDDSTRLRAGGLAAFNHSSISTIPFIGGADADYSAILGGKNIDISSVAERAVVLGMDNFTASESATTYVDNFYVNGYMDFNSGATLPSPKAGRLFFSGTPLFRLMLNTGGTVADWIVINP